MCSILDEQLYTFLGMGPSGLMLAVFYGYPKFEWHQLIEWNLLLTSVKFQYVRVSIILFLSKFC